MSKWCKIWMCLHHKKGWNLANSLTPCNMVFIAQTSCFLEDVNSFDSGHQFRTHKYVLSEVHIFFFFLSWKLWDVSCYNVNHIWTQNFLNGKSILSGQKGQSICNFPCSTPFCAELCTQSFQSILKRAWARMDVFEKCAVPPGHFCLNISHCVWAVVHTNWAVFVHGRPGHMTEIVMWTVLGPLQNADSQSILCA